MLTNLIITGIRKVTERGPSQSPRLTDLGKDFGLGKARCVGYKCTKCNFPEEVRGVIEQALNHPATPSSCMNPAESFRTIQPTQSGKKADMAEMSQGVPVPMRDSKPWYKVEYPRGSDKHRHTILADTFLGEVVHFNGRSLGCTRDAWCIYCKRCLPKKWSGYVATYFHNLKCRSIFSPSVSAARELLKVRAKYGTLRGVVILAKRLNPANDRSRMVVEIQGREDPEKIMKEHPILDSLNRLLAFNGQWLAKMESTGMTPTAGMQHVGVPLPDEEGIPDWDKPTPQQYERLRENLAGFGQFKSEEV